MTRDWCLLDVDPVPGGGHEGNDEPEEDEIEIPDPPVRDVLPEPLS